LPNHLSKKRKQFATGEFVKPAEWNSKRQKAISYSIESQQLNTQLEIIAANIKKEYLKLQLSELRIYC
jgi:integrase/recombinase XerD